jgi:Uncharacterized protein conserved in bacteria (DUF2255)
MARATNARRPKGPATLRRRRFSRSIVEDIDQTKYVGIKAGARSDHRFIGIWAVVVDGRVFVRSWTLRPGGWYRTFLEDPLGALQCGQREVRVRAVPARSERRSRRRGAGLRGEVQLPGIAQVRARIPDAPAAGRHDGAQTPVNVRTSSRPQDA